MPAQQAATDPAQKRPRIGLSARPAPGSSILRPATGISLPSGPSPDGGEPDLLDYLAQRGGRAQELEMQLAEAHEANARLQTKLQLAAESIEGLKVSVINQLCKQQHLGCCLHTATTHRLHTVGAAQSST